MKTEERNPSTRHLDRMDSLQIVTLINREDQLVAETIAAALPRVAEAVDGIVARLKDGGRLVYAGAGTSGRLGVLDAVECPPTFGVDPGLVIGVLAGGFEACYRAVESAEDSEEDGRKALDEVAVSGSDAVVGIAASGATPFTCGAVQHARQIGAFTVGVSCNLDSPLGKIAHVAIEVETGPEVVAGSTRMKAGTAQKLILNMLSTGSMIRLGHIYDNLMVNVHLSNRKLVARGVSIIQQITGASPKAAAQALETAGDVRTAVLMLQRGYSLDQARQVLSSAGDLRSALVESPGDIRTHD